MAGTKQGLHSQNRGRVQRRAETFPDFGKNLLQGSTAVSFAWGIEHLADEPAVHHLFASNPFSRVKRLVRFRRTKTVYKAKGRASLRK